jgi:hypothetical protein
VDDLVFIGHPVCRDDEDWTYTDDAAVAAGERGRTTTRKAPLSNSNSATESRSNSQGVLPEKYSVLDSFHLVLVLDHPDPSSAASGNLSKYFDQIYEHVVFPVTAVLFQEQMLRDFVERECLLLSRIEERYKSESLWSLHQLLLCTLISFSSYR